MNKLIHTFKRLTLILFFALFSHNSCIGNTLNNLESLIRQLDTSTTEQRYRLLTVFKDAYIKQLKQKDETVYDNTSGWRYINKYLFKLNIDYNNELVTVESREGKIPFTSFQLPFAPKDNKLERIIELHVSHKATIANGITTRMNIVINERGLEPSKTLQEIAGDWYTDNYFDYEIVTVDGKKYWKFTPTVPFLLNFTPFKIEHQYDFIFLE